MNRLLMFALAIVLARPVWAHGGEDHGDAPAPLPVAAAAPRVAAETEQFELVGVAQGKVLTLYLDQFGTNAPVAKAQIEIESGTWKAVATEVEPAVYTVSADLLAQPGKHPLTFTVQAGEATDLMDGSLEIPQPGTSGSDAAHASAFGAWPIWAGALALLATGLLFVARRMQRQRS